MVVGRGVGGPQHRDKTGVGRAEAQQQQRLRRGLVIVVGQPDRDERRAQNQHDPAESESRRQEGGPDDCGREQDRGEHNRQVRQNAPRNMEAPARTPKTRMMSRARRRGGIPTKAAGSTPTASGMPSDGSRSATTAAGIAYTTPTRACGQDQAMAG